MIELHYLENNKKSEEIKQKLSDLVVAYSSHPYTKSSAYEHPLPHLRENGKIITGDETIRDYLYELEMELRQQRSITGDGCYIDPDTGKVC